MCPGWGGGTRKILARSGTQEGNAAVLHVGAEAERFADSVDWYAVFLNAGMETQMRSELM